MKLIRLYSFWCPTAKLHPSEYKSMLSPSSQAFANGLPSPWQKQYELFQEQESKPVLRYDTSSGAEG